MNRYKITYDNGTELLLYYKDKLQIPLKDTIGTVISIEQYTDLTHEKYIELIKNKSKFLGYDCYGRECYKSKYYKGYIVIKLSKDKTSESYYDFALYQEYVNGKYVYPATYTMSTPQKVYSLLAKQNIQYIVYSHRYYGEPKLSKPNELKNIKSIGSAAFIPKKCNCSIYIQEDNIWIKHTDYFSAAWKPPKNEKIGMPLSYYLSKYFSTSKKDKFIYPDTWGSIILRNEAWILLKNGISLVETENSSVFAKSVLKEQVKDEYSKGLDEYNMDWMRFYENVHRVVKDYLNEENITKK